MVVVRIVQYKGKGPMFAPQRRHFDGSDHFCHLLRHVVHRVCGELLDNYVGCIRRHDGVYGPPVVDGNCILAVALIDN